MSSVNDLAETYRDGMGYLVETETSVELQKVARTSWHPLSELPTEEDGDEDGEVLLWLGYGVVDQVHYSRVYARGVMQEDHDQWARIRDVVLFPIGDR